jgi:hypothetical protein
MGIRILKMPILRPQEEIGFPFGAFYRLVEAFIQKFKPAKRREVM